MPGSIPLEVEQRIQTMKGGLIGREVYESVVPA